jgi:ABC-2 type transport system ATP-binding protein
MIRISNLSKKYKGVYALMDVNLEIESGSIFGLLGPNGAGKTTLISSLVGLTKYDAGTVVIDRFDLREKLAYIQSISSLIPQNLAFYPTLTGIENLEFFAGMLGLKGRRLQSRIDHVVEVTRLNKVLYKLSGTYSGGLKRRLNIAIGLLGDPRIIYLDEPTVGIDPQSRNFILESIKAMRDDDKHIIYTSHYIEEVEFLCDKIAIIDSGEIIKQGDLDQLLMDFKAVIRTDNNTFEVELNKLSSAITNLLDEGTKIYSIEYGHNLENYFLQLTDKAVRD